MDDTNARTGKNLLNGIGDGRNIRRAGPSLKFVGVHGLGIAAGEGVFGFGEGEDVEFAVEAGLVGKKLCIRERNEDGFILRTTRKENACDPMRRRNFGYISGRKGNFIPNGSVI